MKDAPGLPATLLDAAVELMGRGGAGGGVLPVSGTSMLPNLRPGDAVAVAFAKSGIRFGDVLVFRQDDYIVVHRFLWRSRFPDGGAALRTRGDGRIGLDPRVDPARVLGLVVAFRDGSGRWWDLRGPGARCWALAVAAHDAAWTVAGAVADRLTRLLGPAGRVLYLREGAFALDRWLLHAAHALLFRLFHARTAPPEWAAAPPAARQEPRSGS